MEALFWLQMMYLRVMRDSSHQGAVGFLLKQFSSIWFGPIVKRYWKLLVNTQITTVQRRKQLYPGANDRKWGVYFLHVDNSTFFKADNRLRYKNKWPRKASLVSRLNTVKRDHPFHLPLDCSKAWSWTAVFDLYVLFFTANIPDSHVIPRSWQSWAWGVIRKHFSF